MPVLQQIKKLFPASENELKQANPTQKWKKGILSPSLTNSVSPPRVNVTIGLNGSISINASLTNCLKLFNAEPSLAAAEAALFYIGQGADPYLADKNGRSLLFLLTDQVNNHNGQFNPYIERLVKDHGVSIDSTYKEKTPLQYIYISTHQTLASKINRELMAYDLIQLGANPHTLIANCTTYLHHLVCESAKLNGEYNELIKSLITQHHAVVDYKDQHGQTPLQCLMNHVTEMQVTNNSNVFAALECARLLVKLGANVSIANKYNDTLMKLVDIELEIELKKKTAGEDEKQLKLNSLNQFKKEIDFKLIQLDRSRHHKPRNDYLTTLFYLANNKNENALLMTLPLDIILMIFEYGFDFYRMGKTSDEGCALARHMFAASQQGIKSGELSVFQSEGKTDNGQTKYCFTFFKSINMLADDYEQQFKPNQPGQKAISIKERRVNKQNILKESIPSWMKHASLYQNPQPLIASFKPTTLFEHLKEKIKDDRFQQEVETTTGKKWSDLQVNQQLAALLNR